MTVMNEQEARRLVMERLDAIVADLPADWQYSAALALHRAYLQGLLTQAAPPVTIMHDWMFKHCLEPDARGSGGGGGGKLKSRRAMGSNVRLTSGELRGITELLRAAQISDS